MEQAGPIEGKGLLFVRNHQSKGAAFERIMVGFLVGIDLSPYQCNSPVPLRRNPGVYHAEDEKVAADGQQRII